MKFGIVKERKSPPDRRVVFTPEELVRLQAQFPMAEVKVESSDIRKEVTNNLNMLYKLFNKYKVKDLKLGQVMDNNDMIKFSKDLTIIPTFLSSKDVVNVKIFFFFKKFLNRFVILRNIEKRSLSLLLLLIFVVLLSLVLLFPFSHMIRI